MSNATDTEIRARIDAVPHWYHQIEIRPGIVTPGINASAATLSRLRLPDRCDGMRALDIGVRDGFFSFELERRGAEVVAIDYMDPSDTGFEVARDLLGSNVEYTVDNVYNVTPERYGTFDIVLFLGVMYHLRDPLLVLDRLWDVCNEDALLALETQICDSALLQPNGSFTSLKEIDPRLPELCLMQFHPGDSLHGDHTNYWSPNMACTRGLMEAAGFEVTRTVELGTRGIFVGRRVFESTQVYHRRIEKATIAEGSDPYVAPGAGAAANGAPDATDLAGAAQDGAAGGAADTAAAGAAPQTAGTASDGAAQDAAALELELAAARKLQLGLESELERTRRELAALQHGPGPPADPPGGPGVRVRRAIAALRQRLR